MNKTVILSGATESFAPVSDITFPNHQAYASKHGYEYRTQIYPEDGGMWPKMQHIREVLGDESNEIVMWVDADAIFTNMERRIEDVLSLDSVMCSLFLTADVNGLNSGVMVMKNLLHLRRLFFAATVTGEWLFGRTMHQEQTALRYFTSGYPYHAMTYYMPQRAMNSYWPGAYDYPGCADADWQEGDWILHLPGLPNEKRVEILKSL